jgi:hypothetical protein
MDVLSVLGLKPQKVKPEQQLNVFQQLIQGVRDYDKSNQEMKRQVEKLVNKQMPQAVTAKANLGQLLGGLLGYPGELVAGGGQNMYGGENTGIVDIPGQIKRMVTNTSTPQEVADFQARLPNVAVQAGVAATGGIKAGEGITRRADRVLGGGTVLDDINALATRPKPAPVNPLKQLTASQSTVSDIVEKYKLNEGVESPINVKIPLKDLAASKSSMNTAFEHYVRGNKTTHAGTPIDVWYDINQQKFTVTDGNHRLVQMIKDGIDPNTPVDVKLTSGTFNDLYNTPKETWDFTKNYLENTRPTVPQPPKGVGQSTLGDIVDPLAKFKKKENLVKIDPVLEIKKQITARDIQGNKVELPAGEALTPYELKGNKYLLKDGNEYVVNKNQYQNIKGNAVKAEAQPFAPELEQTTETVKGVETIDREAIIKQLEGSGITPRFDAGGVKYIDKDGRLLDESDVEFALGPNSNIIRKSNPTKFSQYTLPGGNNYREVLIQAPAERMTVTRPDGSKFNEALSPNNFTSSHWDEPNVLAHVRLNDRTYNGKPVTFIEEIQSDWAREVRKAPKTKYIAEKATNQPGNQWWVTDTLDEHDHGRLFDTKKEAQAWIDKNGATPTNPMLKKWQELAAKRALKDAVDNNSEYLAWTTGEQQAARYDLSKQVENISWTPEQSVEAHNVGGRKMVSINPNGRSTIQLWIDKNNKVVKVGDNQMVGNWMGKDIGEVIGKGVGEKIAKQSEGNLSGEGLKIGGEWANNLYDRQLPNIIEKLTGQKAEIVDLDLPVDTRNDEGFWKTITNGVSKERITPENVKPGMLIADSSRDRYVVTRVMPGGEIKVIDDLVSSNEYEIYEKILKRFKDARGDTPQISEISDKLTKDDLRLLDKYSEKQTIKINKASGQMGIKLTPQVKAKVRGEAPPVKQPSGVNPLLMLMGALGLGGMMTDKKRKQGIVQNYLGM